MGRGMKAGKRPKTSGGGKMSQMQQMQKLQALQREADAIQAEIEQKEITTTAGGGAVEVTVNGKKEITALKLDKEVVDPDDVEMLQDLVISAVNEAMRQIEEIANNEMSKLTGGMNIPGLM